MYGHREPRWKADKLYVGTRQAGFSIAQDAQYPSMYRVVRPDGSLSDMLSRIRATDNELVHNIVLALLASP